MNVRIRYMTREAKLEMMAAVLMGLWVALLAMGCNNGYQTFVYDHDTVCYWTFGG